MKAEVNMSRYFHFVWVKLMIIPYLTQYNPIYNYRTCHIYTCWTYDLMQLILLKGLEIFIFTFLWESTGVETITDQQFNFISCISENIDSFLMGGS